ncbi:zeta toxin family protein [Streptomyces sp. ITFR-16]|uniref:zeta toxin family protein n=1 Tax=Streptomyces sp. ITFR-16 TaxID=3075198 RepID=UPI00288A374F|nr:zeta toxin family protein [Streptomyces sp. ITFR-16]WNI20423.1 zeta toxin family protein [Streptomyces sp. ITFR-16]
MIDPVEVERHRLPQPENERIFNERIVPDQLEGRVPQQTPTVVFLIGQPGAGKSRLTELVAAALNRHGGFVDIDSDLYKPYHPSYDDLMAQDDTLMAAYTRADGRAWMALAEAYVRDHKLHAIVQETSQNAAAVEEKMLAYRTAGARVEALFMGVSQAQSNQGIDARYIQQLADRGQGRLTVQSNADESYAGILELADRVDASRLADLVSLYRRGESKPRYANALDGGGQWSAEPQTRTQLERERARPLSAREAADFVEVQLHLREATRTLGAPWPARLARTEEMALPLLSADQAARLTPSPLRPSVAAARSRSTTISTRPRPGQGSAPETRNEVPRRPADGPDQRGRSK